MPAIWTQGDFQLIENESTGRAAMVWPSGRAVEMGDSGVRDLTPVLQNVSAGVVRAQRIGSLVTIHMESVRLTASGNVVIVSGAAVAGMSLMAPEHTHWIEAEEGARIGIAPSGSIVINPASTGKDYEGTITFVTSKPWWSGARPGVADGDVI